MHDNVLSTEASDTIVELTGYRLLTTGVILGIGVPKAVYSYNGQALISTTLDWLVGVILALILFWLGVIEAKRPELSPRFFQVDLAPPVLRFLCRPEVHLWLLSALRLLQSTMHLLAMLDVRRNYARYIPAYVIKDGLALSVLAFSTAIYVFCVQCVRVIWPRGTRHHDPLPFIIDFVMWLAYFLYATVKEFWREGGYQIFRVVFKMTLYNKVWMFPLTLLPFPKQLPRKEGIRLLAFTQLMMAAYLVLVEAALIWTMGFPNFPGSLYGIFFSCYAMVFFSCRFFASVPTSWVPSFAHIWSTSEAV